MRAAAPILLVVGLALIVAAVLAWSGWLGWFGRLPGDIRIQRENMRFYAPITSMLIVSVVLSLIVAVIRRLR